MNTDDGRDGFFISTGLALCLLICLCTGILCHIVCSVDAGKILDCMLYAFLNREADGRCLLSVRVDWILNLEWIAFRCVGAD